MSHKAFRAPPCLHPDDCHWADKGWCPRCEPVAVEPQVSETPSRAFQYLLNALEDATSCSKPFARGYSDKRQAVLDHVATLRAELAEARASVVALTAERDALTEDAERWRAVKPTLHPHSTGPHGGYYMATEELMDSPMPQADEYADRMRAARHTGGADT